MQPAEQVDAAQLEGYLRVLAYRSRLELLGLLRYPRALHELRLPALQSKPGENPDRPSSRQALRKHLDKLLEVGVVVSHEAPGARGRRYQVNQQRLYQIAEDVRRLASMPAEGEPSREATMGLDSGGAARAVEGPRLVLVHGLGEGRAFPLERRALQGDRGWVLGRKAGLHVSLPYDPFVSLENSEVVPHGDDHLLMDLRSSRNGTWLNWRRLGKDERVPLKPGNVVGVGRSLLVFTRD